MDIFSIVASATALATTIGKLSITLIEFAHRVQASRHDIGLVKRELVSLKDTLDYLTGDLSEVENGDRVLPSFVSQLMGIITGCESVVEEIERTISQFGTGGLITRAQWATMGHGDMEKLRSSLEAHKMALAIGLDMLLLWVFLLLGIAHFG